MSSTSIEEIVSESIRIVRAQERVGSMLGPMEQLSKQIEEILKIAPELGPELNAVRERLTESLGHVTAALSVIQAKIDLL